MSYVDPQKLKGTLDPAIPFFTSTLTFTTAVLTIDSLSQFGAYMRSFRIVNLDAAANAQYRMHQATEPQKPIPPSSDVTEESWSSFVQITPNAVSGNGFIEMELVKRKDAERK